MRTRIMDVIAKGALIAHYRVLEPLGAGGMGAVYKAHDEKLHRIVALKVLTPESVSDKDRRRRFLQEARAASRLNHPHILTVFDVGDADDKPYMAMEYVEGETLRRKIDAGSLSLAEALEVAVQVAEGLTCAHDHGIIHRDLKPENLIVSRNGYAKILDFGLAKLVESRKALVTGDSTEKTLLQVKTESGTIMGTISYMSPEQLLGQRVDTRSDIFSFGIVLYEILTGRCPFRNENRIDTMHAILHVEPPAPHTLKPGLPAALEQILSRALRKSPGERYQQMKELCADLKALKRDVELGKATRTTIKTKLVLKRVAALPRPPRIDYERELNESQYSAVTTMEGPLLIVAGAGTGKTRTLVYRVAHLVESNVKPESVLLLSFTRRAATAMLARAALLADQRCQRVSGGTFHSLAHSVLRKYAEEAGVSRTFTVLDQSDTEDVIDLVRRQMKLTARQGRFPRKRTLCSIYSMSVNKLLPVREVVKTYYPQFAGDADAIETLHARFEAFKRERHLLSYDDLLVRLHETLEAHPALCERLSDQYRYLMVDEYQDTNRLQARIMRRLAAGHDNVAVVGDECQSIYSFRGASFRNMLEFPELFPAARVIKLEENFRSTQPILNVANAIMAEAPEGYSKQLFSGVKEGEPPVLVGASDENEQSRFICERIEELREGGVPLSEIAVLFRASSHSFDLELELSRHAIPFRKFGGIKFAESAHIKDALSFLRTVVNPSDTLSWFRMLKLFDHIGDATVEQILDYLNVERRDFKTARAKESLFGRLKQFPARTSYQDHLTKLSHTLCNINEEKSPHAQLTTVLRLYRPVLRARYDDHPRRLRDLEHLREIARRYKTAAELLADVAMDPNDVAPGGRERSRGAGGYVTLSTVHSAKGLEWKALFIIWVMDGWFPSSRSTEEFEDLEEERRLLYVAATRAKEQLYFVYPENAYNRSEPDVPPSVSRFLEPIPQELLPRATLAGTE
jgi:DNA helicase II / ATP-dependent DNA helicase PcrA